MMGSLLNGLIFTQPLLLFALAGLPVLWFLLRVMPPRPRVIVLPSLRFLEGLLPEKTSPSHTPWWILLLRLLILALVILALSGPVMNPSAGLESDKPLRLVIDNGWSAAPVWDAQLREADNLIAQAERANIPVLLLTTAAVSAPEAQDPPRLMAAAEARSTIKGIAPRPWDTDYLSLIPRIEAMSDQEFQSVWLSDGIAHRGFDGLAKALAAKRSVSLFHPAPEALALALNIRHSLSGVEVILQDADESGSLPRPVTVQAVGEDGRVLGFQTYNISEDNKAPLFFEMPEALRGNVTQYRLAGTPGAGGVFLLDESFKRRSVGIAAPGEKSDRAPLVEASYYLRRALEPYADLAFDTVEALTAQNRSMIILPDVAAMPLSELNALESWVDKGGLLLRFAGPVMADNVNNLPLVPVPLRQGGRALEGSLTGGEALKIQEFSPESPLAGLEIPKDIVIRQQVLADPAEDMTGKVWAALEDGTPLITAKPYGKGLLVMVHTSAGPDWSDLPLSGLFVEMLRRLAALSHAPTGHETGQAAVSLDPIMVLDGFGVPRKPDAGVKPITVSEIAGGIKTGPDHPPGLYGRSGLQVALNLGTQKLSLKILTDVPAGVRKTSYGQSYEFSLMPFILTLAAVLALLDWLVMSVLALTLRWPARGRKITVMVIGVFLMSLSTPVHATPEDDLKHAGALYLAYIKTGDGTVDSQSGRGLGNLAKALSSRTSAEPAGVAGIDIESDALAFFPWIFWPVTETQKPPSPAALQKIQFYLDHGGTILFDLRYGAGQNIAASQNLQKITGALNIPPLQPIPKDHVLGRTFYLLDIFPGLHTTGELWVEKGAVKGRDGVSSVLIGSNDWAAAWAAEGSAGSLPGGSRQGEMAMRFGINVTMYALTGNYKADQVHVPYILERLER